MLALMAPESPEMQWKITRSFARFGLELPVSVLLSETASIPVSSGRTRDISLGGMAALLDAPLAVGQRVWLEFRLSQSAAPMRLLAKIRHDYGERFGFQFLTITPEQREEIRQACQGQPIV